MAPEGGASSDYDLAGKAAIVTGAARGIGLATAERLVAHGASVLISDLDGDLASEVAGRLGAGAVPCEGDITAAGGAEAVVHAAADAFGRIDVIVNNAGYNRPALAHKMEDDAFQAMLDIHLWAPFRIIRAAAPWLREPAKQEAERGEEVFRKIVNVSSIVGTAGSPLELNYAAGKAGIIGVTKSLAKEWGRFKVNVNAVAFGFIATRLNAPKTDDNVISVGGGSVALGIRSDFRDAELARAAEIISLGRWGTTDEAAAAVFFLCSPLSNYVHGQVLHVNGGLMSGMSE
jgi:3-oxoacyl-[acyl-carrier protein] reductase